MDESLICECGNEKFWYFWQYVRCTKCHNEYKQTSYEIDTEIDIITIREQWMRRFNNKENNYNNNWEKVPEK